MFIAMLFVIARVWKQPRCPSVNEWIKKAAVRIYNGILHSSKKERTLTFCNSIDGPGDHYAK